MAKFRFCQLFWGLYCSGTVDFHARASFLKFKFEELKPSAGRVLVAFLCGDFSNARTTVVGLPSHLPHFVAVLQPCLGVVGSGFQGLFRYHIVSYHIHTHIYIHIPYLCWWCHTIQVITRDPKQPPFISYPNRKSVHRYMAWRESMERECSCAQR
jgi:hypothetical protein